MIDTVLRKGGKFWAPKNKSICYIIRGGMASGKDILVGTNPFTGDYTTILTGKKLVRPRMRPLD